MQAETGQVHVCGPASAIQNSENVFDFGDMVGANPFSCAFFK
jgi:hypothetical protein